MVGKGSPAPYRRQARRLGVDERLKFWGPQTDLAPFYQAATVLALPTIYDPCSNVVLEALACGAPVITTAANGAGEFLTPGENGEVMERPDDLAGLTRALEDLPPPGRGPGGAPGRSRRSGPSQLGGHRGPNPDGTGGSRDGRKIVAPPPPAVLYRESPPSGRRASRPYKRFFFGGGQDGP